MEQVEGVSVIGFVFSCHAHHQHEVEEAMCSVAGIPEAFEAHFSQRAFDVSVGNPFYSFAVELRIGSMRTELARAAEFERKMPGTDNGDPLAAWPFIEETTQRAA